MLFRHLFHNREADTRAWFTFVFIERFKPPEKSPLFIFRDTNTGISHLYSHVTVLSEQGNTYGLLHGCVLEGIRKQVDNNFLYRFRIGPYILLLRVVFERSEERRVGKEC